MVPGQWSYTVGPCFGLDLGDQVWLSRYILLRCTERQNLVASLDPKPVPGDWNGSSAYIKYSTRETRDVRFKPPGRTLDAYMPTLCAEVVCGC